MKEAEMKCEAEVSEVPETEEEDAEESGGSCKSKVLRFVRSHLLINVECHRSTFNIGLYKLSINKDFQNFQHPKRRDLVEQK